MFGEDFERFDPDAEEDEAPVPGGEAPKAVGKAKKGKLQSKKTGHTYQFQIMQSIGVPLAEVKKFADPWYWASYFPPIAIVSVRAPSANCTNPCRRKTTRRLVRASTGGARS